MAEHRLDAAPDTVHWGYLDAALKPHIIVDFGQLRDDLDRLRRAATDADTGLGLPCT